MTTERLLLRHMDEADADFILILLNQPSFIRFIGDKGVRTVDDARDYIRTGPIASYQQYGFGLYLVAERASGRRLGVCGILKKPALPHFDLGFAFMPEHWGKGYAHEAAAVTLAYARSDWGLSTVCAVADPENSTSIKLLHKLGMQHTGRVQLAPDDKELELFELDLRQ